MKTLSGLDASFLYLESAETPMHVGSLHLYALPTGFRGSFHKVVQRHIAERLHLVPLLRQRLAFMPLDMGHPGWVNAENVDLHFHIRREAGQGKAGGQTVQEMQDAVARLHGQLMDRTRPLWEFHIFENVQAPPGTRGRLVGFYAKLHHAALDGKAGAALAHTILDLSATPRPVPPVDPERLKRRQVGDPGTGEMIASVLSNSLGQYVKLARSLPGAARAIAGTVAGRVFESRKGSTDWLHPLSPLGLAPRTRFNTAITSRRSLATASLPFADCQAMAHAAGCSFNDMVLWLCATALRDYLSQHGKLPRKSLVAAMPVSLREEGNQDLNTQASMMLVDLGTQYADPLRRMRAIVASTTKVKAALADYKSLLPTDYPSLLAPWLVGGVAKAAYKVYSATGLDRRLPMLANLVISNVPGPQAPLYLAGARMLSYHPLSIVTHGMALNITVQTYAGSVDFGLVADEAAAPQLQDLADALVTAFDAAKAQLAARPGKGVSTAVPSKPRVAVVTNRPASTPRTKPSHARPAAGSAKVATRAPVRKKIPRH
jgi:diacylglycerol O-acyltransferase / wax synthase